jgi:hypothetical protein
LKNYSPPTLHLPRDTYKREEDYVLVGSFRRTPLIFIGVAHLLSAGKIA